MTSMMTGIMTSMVSMMQRCTGMIIIDVELYVLYNAIN